MAIKKKIKNKTRTIIISIFLSKSIVCLLKWEEKEWKEKTQEKKTVQTREKNCSKFNGMCLE